MSVNYFLVPTAQVTLPDGSTTNAPEYVIDLGLPFTSIPMGVEGIAIVALTAPSAALSANADVYSFPNNLATTLSADDVTALVTYLNANSPAPTSQIQAGSSWQTVLRQLAQIFIACQFISGQTGQSVFTVQAKLKGQLASPASAALVALTPGVFDFGSANPSDSVADTLLAASAQFTGPIHVGGTL